MHDAFTDRRGRAQRLALLAVLAAVAAALFAATASADTRTVVSSGTTKFAPKALVGGEGIADPEFREEEDAAEGGGNGPPFPNRPFGRQKKLFPGQTLPAPSVTSSGVAGSNPELNVSFDGLTFRQQRTANGGNQFSVEPPDQALCVGGGKVLEAVNTVARVYNQDGSPATGVMDLNTFFGYPAAIDRTPPVVRGPFLTDPVCYFDPENQRFVLVVLTLDVDSVGDFTGGNHLDIAVSNSSDPATATWTIYKIQVQDDGNASTPRHHNCPCIGDYPHIGADKNGVYITTNEYSFFGAGFNGAQIYALPKAQLYAGPTLSVTQIEDTRVNGSPGFTLSPATSNPGDYASEANGTEYFLSTIAGDGSETGNPTGSADKIAVWALTNTASIADKNPKLRLESFVLPSQVYVFPPLSNQKTTANEDFPLGQCINDTSGVLGDGHSCWELLFGEEPAHDEVVSSPDSSDTRMFQVWYRAGKLFGAAGTGMNLTSDTTTRAGIAWWSLAPSLRVTGATSHLSASIASQGYLGLAKNNVTYPAFAVRPDGTGVIAFSVMGDDYYPSAGYSVFDGASFGPIHVAGLGVGVDDGFTSYKAFVGDPPRTRWGDYGAAVTDGSSFWIASQYIGQRCTLEEWLSTRLNCGGTRSALGNWYTRVSKVTP